MLYIQYWQMMILTNHKFYQVNAKCIVDGDGFTAYVDTVDPRESENVPLEVREAVISRDQARSCRNYQRANALRNIVQKAGYKYANLTIYTFQSQVLKSHQSTQHKWLWVSRF